MTLWVLCEHGEKGEHGGFRPGVAGTAWSCLGGRPASPEDLIEALVTLGKLRVQERELCATCKFPPHAHEPTAQHPYSPWIQKVWVPLFGVPESILTSALDQGES